MPGGYWGGLVEGFQGRREGEYEKNYAREKENRVMADRVFGQLLNSRDPELQQLALSGLMQPITKKKGFRGFLGEVDSTNPVIQQIVARSNEMVPDEAPAGAAAGPSSAPTPPPAPPGSAAMSTNQTVTPGAAPITPPPPVHQGMGPAGPGEGLPPGAPEAPPELGPQGGPAAGLMPPPPPEHPMHRRGTMVPTAEEIAGATMEAQLNGRIKAVTAALVRQGASREQIASAILGIAGAPQNQRVLQPVSAWGVKVPGSDIVQPVLLDTTGDGGYMLANGQPLPPGSTMVRMSGASGAGSAITSKIPDSPEGRQYLLAQGVDAAEIQGGSPSGYWKVVTRPDGTVGVQADMYTPPPAFSGTTVLPDTAHPQVPVRSGIDRDTGATVPLGDEPTAVKSQTQLDAEGLLQAVDDEVRLRTSSNILKKSPTPQQRDQIVKDLARQQKLPYQSYTDLTRAVKSSTPITARERETGGTITERVRARALANRGQGEVRPPIKPALPPAAPPPVAPARARGAGPVGQ